MASTAVPFDRDTHGTSSAMATCLTCHARNAFRLRRNEALSISIIYIVYPIVNKQSRIMRSILLQVAVLSVCVMVCVTTLVYTQTWGVCPSRPVKLDEYLRGARCGDLAFFRDTQVDLAHDLVSGFTHVGVVFRGAGEDARLLEIRGGDEARGSKAGVSSPNLRRRVLEFDGAVYIAPIRTPVDAEALARAFGRMAGATYPENLRMHVAGCKLWPAYDPGAAMMCSEFALRLLGARWRSQTPADVMAMCQRGGEYGCASQVVTT